MRGTPFVGVPPLTLGEAILADDMLDVEQTLLGSPIRDRFYVEFAAYMGLPAR